MNFLKSFGFGSGSLGGLPYSIEKPEESNLNDEPVIYLPDYELIRGISKTDKSRVSVFRSKEIANERSRNGMKRLRTMRHPNVLNCLDGVETPKGQIIIITEEVVPLSHWIENLRRESGENSEEEQKAILWGLHSILSAFKFIHSDCKLIHGNIVPTSIFVTKGGDWKLGGFEVLSECTVDGPSNFFKAQESQVDNRYKSQERLRCEWKTIGTSPPSSCDMWSLGCLIYQLFNGNFQSGTEVQSIAMNRGRSTNHIPRDIMSIFQAMMKDIPNQRIIPEKALEANCFTRSDFVKTMLFVESIAVKETQEKADFYKELTNQVPLFSKACARYKILPALRSVVDIGGGDKGGIKLDPSASFMLPAMLRIGKDMMDDDFKTEVLPIVVRLFACNDRALRVQLLQSMESFSAHLDTKLVNSTIFDNICTGFTDTSPLLRELTVKSMLYLSDKLSDNNLNTRCMRYFAKLQSDPEPAIRTNTTICLGRVAKQLNEATRQKALLPGFSRALKDPFPHARVAGIRAMYACEEFFEPSVISSKVLPCLCPLLMDPSTMVREEAFSSVNNYIKKLVPISEQMKEAEKIADQKAKEEAKIAAEAKTSDAQHEGGSYAASLAGWAASSVVSGVGKLVTRGSEELMADEVPPAAPVSELKSTKKSVADWDEGDNDWGGDNWGGDADLDLDSPKTTTTDTTSLTLNKSTTKPTLQASSDSSFFDDDWGTDATKHVKSTRGSGLSIAGAQKKSLEERRREAKEKREKRKQEKIVKKAVASKDTSDDWDW